MEQRQAAISRIGLRDQIAVTRMVHANMTGVDQQFTRLIRPPLARWLSYLWLPIYFTLAGEGYKAVVDGEMAGGAYLDLRPASGYIFNVSVNRPFRRRGVARQLMAHLEKVIRGRGRHWAALQVDYGNAPARALYRDLGYRAYHPDLLRWEGPAYSGAAIGGDVAVEALAAEPGRAIYAHHLAAEQAEGDGWARAALHDYAHLLRPPGGRYWRCRVRGQEVGAAVVGRDGAHLAIRLALRPAAWGDGAAATAVELIVAEQPGMPRRVDLYLGSSLHHQAAAPLFESLGFRPYTLARLLMLKRLAP